MFNGGSSSCQATGCKVQKAYTSLGFLSPLVQLAWWAHIHHFLSVCLSVRLSGLENNSLEIKLYFGKYQR